MRGHLDLSAEANRTSVEVHEGDDEGGGEEEGGAAGGGQGQEPRCVILKKTLSL